MRHLFRLLRLLSVLLAIAVMVLWARSKLGHYDMVIHFDFEPKQRLESYSSLESFNGIITLNWNSSVIPNSPPLTLPTTRTTNFGFGTQYYRPGSMGDRFELFLGLHW